MPIDFIIFVLIAIFLIFRLGSVLGKRTGHQKPPDFMGRHHRHAEGENGNAEDDEDNVVHLPGSPDTEDKPESAAFSGPAGPGLKEIRNADPDFDPDQFVDGAKIAFEMIVTGFANGDRDTLRSLLANDTYEDFARAIDARETADQRMEDTLIGIDELEIEDARLNGTMAEVTVRIESKQVNVLYGSDGEVVDGDPQKVETVVDIWSFARDTQSSDPNWRLIGTRSE